MNITHLLDECPCGDDHRRKVDDESSSMKLREVDLYEILAPILERPGMYFGESITAFWTFYMGLRYLGSVNLGGPPVYKLNHDLFAVNGFFIWAFKKHGWSGADIVPSHYLWTAKEKMEAEGGLPRNLEKVAFWIFVDDLREFQARV